MIQLRHKAPKISWCLREKKNLKKVALSVCFMSRVVTLLIHSLVGVQVTLVHAASVETCWMLCLTGGWGDTLNYSFNMSNRVSGLQDLRGETHSDKEGAACGAEFSQSVYRTRDARAWRSGSDITVPSRSRFPPGRRLNVLFLSAAAVSWPLLSPPSCQ